MTATTEAQVFLARHFGTLDEDETVEIRAFQVQTRALAREWFDDFDAAYAFAEEHAFDHDVYYGLNPRLGRKGTKDAVSRIVCLHADMDWKLFDGDREAGLRHLVEFEVEPSSVVDSGGGLHVTWTLATPLANDPALVTYAESLMRRLYYRLAPGEESLDGVQNIDRIFRVPGTLNHKPAHGAGGYLTRVLHQSDRRYDLEEFDRVLPLLPERVPASVANARSGASTWTTGDIEAMLGHIDPDLPYNEWVSVLMGVHSAFPGQEGFDLCDRWSTATREANGRNGSLLKQPEKWWGFRRGEGQVRATLGTVVRLAMDGGWTPPKGPNLVLRVPGEAPAVPEWRRLLADFPALGRDEMPLMLRRVVQHLEPLTLNWAEDWAETLALTGLSLLYPETKFEDSLGLNLWWLGVAPQAAGKSRSTEEVYKLARAVSVRGEFGLKAVTSATPEGYGTALDGDRVALVSYHSEYGGFLSTLKREHMKAGKEVLCDLYDGKDWVYQRSQVVVSCISPYLGVIATTTGTSLTANAERRDLQTGYLARFWFAAPDTGDRDLGYVSDLSRATLAEELLEHVLLVRGLPRARFDTPFGQDPPLLSDLKRSLGLNTGRVRTYEESLVDEELPAGRLIARVKKVACLLEALEASPRIKGDTLLVREGNVALAVRLAMRCSAYAARVARSIGSTKDDDNAEKLLRAMRRLKPEERQGIDFRQMMQKSHLNKAELLSSLDILKGEIEKFDMGRKEYYRLVRG
jgi:hypothetical protein